MSTCFRRVFFLICLFFVSASFAIPPYAIPKRGTQKRILFVQPWFVGGGMGTAFVALLNNFPDPNAHIDITVRAKKGIYFSPILRKNVSVIDFSKALLQSYDTVVCYAQWMQPHVWVEPFHAKKRVLWIHGDIQTGNWVEHLQNEKKLSDKIDAFVCVSQTAANSFLSVFPEYTKKTHVIYSFVDNARIKKSAQVVQTDMKRKDGKPIIVTVSRLAAGKGLETSIQAHALLEKEGFHSLWYVVGEGNRRPVLEALIKEHGVQDSFILLGYRENPFPYVKDADIFSLLSKAEGFCLALTEAKILQKPILVTNFTTAYEQIASGKNGLIVEDSLPAICTGLKKLLTDQGLRAQFSQALQGFEFNNENTQRELSAVLAR